MACKISRFKCEREYLGNLRIWLIRERLQKKVEIIKAVQEILNELDQDIIRNCETQLQGEY